MSPTDEIMWAIYFAGICSIRFHPRNELPRTKEIVKFAAEVADLMMEEHHKRYPATEEPCPG